LQLLPDIIRCALKHAAINVEQYGIKALLRTYLCNAATHGAGTDHTNGMDGLSQYFFY